MKAHLMIRIPPNSVNIIYISSTCIQAIHEIMTFYGASKVFSFSSQIL